MLKLTWPQAAAWRVRRHHLDRRAPAGSMLAVASRLCGLHAQLMSSAELTVWARVEDLDRKAVQRALWEDRSLVKTWAMRGTLHLLPAGELPLWRAVLSTSRRYLREALWQKYFGITLEELDRVTEAIATALDGRVMTREELVREVGRLTGSAAFSAKTRAELGNDAQAGCVRWPLVFRAQRGAACTVHAAGYLAGRAGAPSGFRGGPGSGAGFGHSTIPCGIRSGHVPRPGALVGWQ